MSDSTDSVETEAETEPTPPERPAVAVAAPAVPAWQVWHLIVNADTGELTVKGEPAQLNIKVYDRGTAVRFAAFEARKSPGPPESRFVVTSPVGRCIAVLAGGTGKPVKSTVAFRTKRALAGVLPTRVVRTRRTSRVPGRSVTRAVQRRRTSRRGGR